MHILGILVFALALIVAGEVIRSTIVANGNAILAALAGEAVAPSIKLAYAELGEPASVIPITRAVRRRVVNRPVSLPLAA